MRCCFVRVAKTTTCVVVTTHPPLRVSSPLSLPHHTCTPHVRLEGAALTLQNQLAAEVERADGYSRELQRCVCCCAWTGCHRGSQQHEQGVGLCVFACWHEAVEQTSSTQYAFLNLAN